MYIRNDCSRLNWLDMPKFLEASKSYNFNGRPTDPVLFIRSVIQRGVIMFGPCMHRRTKLRF